MKLQKLTKAILEESTGKRICCVKGSETYLQEMEERFQLGAKFNNFWDGKTENSLLVIAEDYYREVFEQLSQNPDLQSTVETVYYFANQETEYEEEFRGYYAESALENIIVFRSGPHISSYMKGMDFTDNARALFEYMLENGYNETYELVWLVKNPEEFFSYRKYPNVTFLPMEWSVSDSKEEREKYYRVLCLAKYFFFTDAYGFVRNARADQVRVQLWHGCGFKTRLNFTPCEKRYDYTTVTSDLYANIHREVFGLRADQMLVTGIPKQDWLVNKSEVPYVQQLELPEAKQYIYWLPTYRLAADILHQSNGYAMNEETGLPVVDTREKMEQLNKLLSEWDLMLVIKLHPYQDRDKIGEVSFSNIMLLDNARLFEKDIQINQLLGEADALISDYSSVAVDYVALNRPMAFLLDDVDEYENKRGFVFEHIRDWLPGKEITSFEGFCGFIKELAQGVDSSKEKREGLRKQLNSFCDGTNCERIIRALGI